MSYGSGCWAVDRRIEQNTIVAELVTLRWTSEVTREDIIKNECVSGCVGVASIVEKMRETSQ